MIRMLPGTGSAKSGHTSLGIGIAVVGVLCWLPLFVGGVIGYPGDKLIYILFSVVFWAMLASGFYRQISYGYLFMVVFLWLGFWFKLTIHTIIDYGYIEPTGTFNGIPAAWNEVLWVAIVAGIGVIAGRVIYGLICGRSTMVMSNDRFRVPVWYLPIRRWLWIFMMLITVGGCIFNDFYGIHQIGLVPRTILLWPFNAVISWMINIGLSIGIATLLWWDISLKKNISLPIYAVLIEGFLTSISVLSRGTYIYHAIPQLFAFYKNKKSIIGITVIKAIFIAIIFIGLFIVSQSAVNTLRAYLFQSGYDFSSKIQMMIVRLEVIDRQSVQLELIQKDKILLLTVIEKQVLEKLQIKIELAEKQLRGLSEERSRLQADLLEEKSGWDEMAGSWSGKAQMIKDEFIYQLGGGIYARILQLSVDRWLGLEGVMAVQSYPGKGKAFFFDGIKEKRKIGNVTLYQELCKSLYRKASKTFQFGSLPGVAAFLYYSGSMWVVMLGMVVFSIFILLIEHVIDVLTANPVLCSLVGFCMANTVAQFGVTPRQDIPYYFMIFSAILIVWFIQSKWFFLVLQKLGLYKSIQFDAHRCKFFSPLSHDSYRTAAG